jgi:hypothetical protein
MSSAVANNNNTNNNIIIIADDDEAAVIVRPYFTEPTPEVLEARRVYDVAIAAWKTSTMDDHLNAELIMKAQAAFHEAVQNMLNEFHAALAARDAAFYAAARKN